MFCKVRFCFNWFHLYHFIFCFVLVCLFGFVVVVVGGFFWEGGFVLVLLRVD